MMMTRPELDGVGRDPEVSMPRRRVERLRGLPSSRALVGGLLVALAGVGTLVAWQQAAGSPEHAYAVAARPILPGETLSPDDVRLVPVDLPRRRRRGVHRPGVGRRAGGARADRRG
jgi:flagella basal body P-ring formation protein FlgA